MRTDDLINNLVADMKPVKPVSSPRKRLSQWLFFSGLAIGCYLLAFDSQAVAKFASHLFVIHVGLFLIISIMAGLAALNLSVPGRPIRYGIVPAVTLTVCFAVLADLPNVSESVSYAQISCTLNLVVVALASAVTMFLMLRKAAPLRPRMTSFYALLASSAIGAIAAETLCPSATRIHVGAFHLVPMFGLSLVGLLVGRKLLNRQPRAL